VSVFHRNPRQPIPTDQLSVGDSGLALDERDVEVSRLGSSF